MSSPAGTHTEPPAPTHLPGEAAKHRQQAQTWMPVSNFPGLEVGNWVTETPVGFFFSPGLVGIARKLSHNAKVSKSSGGAHPIDEETKIQQVEGVCHATGAPSFTLDIIIFYNIIIFCGLPPFVANTAPADRPSKHTD